MFFSLLHGDLDEPWGFVIIIFVFSFFFEGEGEVYIYFTSVFIDVSDVPGFFDV